MNAAPINRPDSDLKSDDAVARAGWLYYAGGMTQDQIAAEMGISRQRAQRLVSRAVANGLIKVRLEHPLAACLELEARLRDRYGLIECRVAPMLGVSADPARVIAPAAASLFEKVLARAEPQVIGVGTGRALRAMSDELQEGTCDRHRLVSLIGNISIDGSATMFEVILYIASRSNAGSCHQQQSRRTRCLSCFKTCAGSASFGAKSRCYFCRHWPDEQSGSPLP